MTNPNPNSLSPQSAKADSARRLAPRTADGSAGDANYGAIGSDYRVYRQPEPAFERAILAALGDAHRVVNVGAGAGSYEPHGRDVTPVEPSESMRAQRPATLATAVDGRAESLPFADNSFDAAMTTFSIHQWRDLEQGLSEMRRVATGPVVILTCDPALLDRFWLNEYAPEVIATEARRYPSIARVAAALGGTVEVEPLGIPLNSVDGFGESYYGRPEKLLDRGARLANSAWSFVAPEIERRAVEHLEADLSSGRWDARHGALRTTPLWQGSLVLITAHPTG